MPVAADGIAQHIFEFWPIESAFAGVDRGLNALVMALRLDALEHVAHDFFGVIPGLVGADAFFRARRQLNGEFAGESKIGISRQDQIVDLQALVGHLLFRAEHVRIVLREAANAQETMQGARRLIAVHGAKFRQPQRQITIGLETVLEDLDVARTIHRLDREDALVFGFFAGGGRLEHVFSEPAPVARGLP